MIMIKKLLALSITFLLTTTALVHAEGDIVAGQTKADDCTSCHGENGNSMVPSFPKLAGQHANYLSAQLLAFKKGARNAPMMAPLAMALDDDSIKDIAAYYAAQKITPNQLPILDTDDDEQENDTAELENLLALGDDLYRYGNLKTKVSACTACHGPSGEGNKPAGFPALKSQHADYLIKSLTDFKQDARTNIPNSIMHMIAKKMTTKEIQAVSYHISMLK